MAAASRRKIASASDAISRTISPAGCTFDTSPTLCPAHSESASMSPSASAPGVYRPAQPIAELNMVSPEFFQTMGLRLMRGRGFAVTDVDGQPPVVIINERLATQFGDGDPIGRRINLGEWVTIVGVVSDVAPPVARRRAEAGGLPAVSAVRAAVHERGGPHRRAAGSRGVGGEDRGARDRSRSAGRRPSARSKTSSRRPPASRASAPRSCWLCGRWRCCSPRSASTA